MNDVISIFESIKNTNSINEKKDIISINKNNELFKRCLVFLIDGNIVTGISDKKLAKAINERDNCVADLSTFLDVIEYLRINNTGRDSDILSVQKFIERQNVSHKQFYKEMVTKKYRLGCDSKVINSVIPNLIQTWDVMLGSPIEKANLKGDELIYISRKLNGSRCSYDCNNNRLMTRQGKIYTGLQHIIDDICSIDMLKNSFIDGELLYKNEDNLTDSEAFQKGVGLAMSKAENKSELMLVIFDVFPYSEYVNGSSRQPYSERYKTLCELETKINELGIKNLSIVERFYNGYDHNKIWEWLDYAESHDYEGCMVNLDTPYERKRVKTLLKVKKFFDITLRVIAVEEGSGRNKGKLGALVCKYYNNTVKVGSGFSDEQRINIWNNKEMYIGKLADVKYKEKTSDKKTGLESLQFPVFLSWRAEQDKSIPDDEV